MDFDGDGIGDLLSGSYEGDLYFFKGKGKGEFAAPVKIKRDGKNINLGASSTVFAVDWRGTGRLDLLVGNMPGDLYLIPNDGTRAKPVYGAPRRLEADGRQIPAPHHGDSQPIAADWDGDGLLDLLVAWGDGSVVWYRNMGSKTEPKLAKGVALVQPAPPANYDDNAPPSLDRKPGVRAKICVVDWNGDGRLDLLVGDFGGIYGAKAALSEQDKKAEQQATSKMQELQKKMRPFYDQYARSLKAPLQGTDIEKAKRDRTKSAQAILKRPDFLRLQTEMKTLNETMRKFRRPPQHQGHVWLYLRKPLSIRPARAEARR